MKMDLIRHHRSLFPAWSPRVVLDLPTDLQAQGLCENIRQTTCDSTQDQVDRHQDAQIPATNYLQPLLLFPEGLPYQSKSAVWVGETGEADPYLLRRYHYDQNDECVLSRITYRHMKIVPASIPHGEVHVEEEPDIIFMLPDDGLAEKAEPRVDDSFLDEAQKEFMNMISDEMGVRLVKLFFRFVYPYFPVISRTQILLADEGVIPVLKSLPLSLLAAIYATSLSFLLYDDVLATTIIHSPPSAIQLYRISWLAIQQEIHAPRLATFQACLLILQRPPTNRYVMDTPYRWSLVAWAVSLAHNLGIQKSCLEWEGLPTWERRLRGRLWWCVYVIDKFFYLGAGMPSHIKNEEFDVQAPTLSDNVTSSGSYNEEDSEPANTNRDNATSVNSYFYHLVTLTMVVSDIIDAFYTLRAAPTTSKSFQLSL